MRVRLGGFEPPTNGLEGRRSSTELQAPEHTGYRGRARRLAQALVPKSAVTSVTGRPSYSPGADAKWIAAMPISRHSRERMFSRCGGLSIHSRTALAGEMSGEPQRMFSPTDQPRPASAG
jgi:hypothetical protein